VYCTRTKISKHTCEAHNKIVKLCSLCTSIFCKQYLHPYHCDELDPELAFLQTTLVLIWKDTWSTENLRLTPKVPLHDIKVGAGEDDYGACVLSRYNSEIFMADGANGWVTFNPRFYHGKWWKGDNPCNLSIVTSLYYVTTVCSIFQSENQYTRSEVLTAVNIMVSAAWDVIPCTCLVR
jgi:hypothetical protein